MIFFFASAAAMNWSSPFETETAEISLSKS